MKKGDWSVAVVLDVDGELPELESGGLSQMLRLFFVSGPDFCEASNELTKFSAVIIRLAIFSREREMESIYQSEGPSYLGIGGVWGYSS